MTETILSDTDIERIVESEPPTADDDAPAAMSRTVERAFARAKRASAKRNERCRREVEELRERRREGVAAMPAALNGQTSIFDFG